MQRTVMLTKTLSSEMLAAQRLAVIANLEADGFRMEFDNGLELIFTNIPDIPMVQANVSDGFDARLTAIEGRLDRANL